MKIVIGIVLLILGFAVDHGFLTLLVLLGISWLVLKGMVAIYRRFFPRDEGTTGMLKKFISFVLKTVSFAFAFFIVITVFLSVAPPREPDVFWKVPRLPAEARQFRYEEKVRIAEEKAQIEKEAIARIAEEKARIEKERIARIAEEKAEERARITEENAQIEKERIARIEKARIEKERIAEEKAEEKARQLKNEYSEYEMCVILARRSGYGVFDTIDLCARYDRD